MVIILFGVPNALRAGKPKTPEAGKQAALEFLADFAALTSEKVCVIFDGLQWAQSAAQG